MNAHSQNRTARNAENLSRRVLRRGFRPASRWLRLLQQKEQARATPDDQAANPLPPKKRRTQPPPRRQGDVGDSFSWQEAEVISKH